MHKIILALLASLLFAMGTKAQVEHILAKVWRNWNSWAQESSPRKRLRRVRSLRRQT